MFEHEFEVEPGCFSISDVLFNASRLDHLYPKEQDRRLIRLLFGLPSSVRSCHLYMISPMDLYRAHMRLQIRPYTLAKDERCELGRERLRALDPAHWTCHVVDLDSHGLGCMELLGMCLTVMHAEFALSPTVLTKEGLPAFYFDHRARGHDGLVISGGNGGRKKCAQFLSGVLEGVRSRPLRDVKEEKLYYRGVRVATEEDAREPV